MTRDQKDNASLGGDSVMNELIHRKERDNRGDSGAR
jgi:hypothetical protein